MRKLKYHVAITLDGFLAHEDHTYEGFLNEGEHVDEFFDSFRTSDIVLMGRKTYDVGLRMGVTSPYPMLRQYVFSRSLERSPDPAVELVRDDVVGCVRALKEEHGKDIWLCGGGELASALLEADLVDEIIVKLSPVVFGTGIPMFARPLQRALSLRSTKSYANGVQLLAYSVTR
ncbi:dihydrofolate reductase family protein [Sandaracinus amylolyticus]|uniref:Dihydrofolate reductase n=1 Tax=Sandaracinus amylolyticus TaxID=927083 RepID=A0A0F6YMX8_9BACT|nr:dihydrofolate reductase family protein [Sandaracinus amylolyticus]AKF11585.1 Dihydrofolate reductase [Sandaracinus amylolyticus]